MCATCGCGADEVRDFFAEVRPRLCVSDASRDAISFVVSPPLIRSGRLSPPARR